MFSCPVSKFVLTKDKDALLDLNIKGTSNKDFGIFKVASIEFFGFLQKSLIIVKVNITRWYPSVVYHQCET